MTNSILVRGVIATNLRHIPASLGRDSITAFRLVADGDYETSSWFTVTSHGDLAQRVRASFGKGDRVFVKGTATTYESEDLTTNVSITVAAIEHDLTTEVKGK
jgi:single-stranded DNA-binding protein